MIIFDLACTQNHRFEGWFHSPADYEGQLEKGLVACPRCGSCAIRRVPSAPHFARPGNAAPQKREAAKEGAAAPAKAQVPAVLPDAVQQLLALVVDKCEDVGSDFASEARKIHYLEAPQRAIRGQASKDDYEELCDEGIDVVRLPVVDKH